MATGDAVAIAHERLRADATIQFDLPTYQPPQPPAWLKPLGEFLQWIAPVAKYLIWGLLGIVAALILWFVIRHFAAVGWPWRRKPRDGEEDEAEWRPEAGRARQLLHEADALAAGGRFAEAAHLLLFRSVEEIERRRPHLVRPALTSRDIARAEGLPATARQTFAAIARTVETSLFGGRAVDADSWQACRRAYEDFAFAGNWR